MATRRFASSKRARARPGTRTRSTRAAAPQRFRSRRRAAPRRRAASAQTIRIVLEQPQPQMPAPLSGNVVPMTSTGPRKARF